MDTLTPCIKLYLSPPFSEKITFIPGYAMLKHTHTHIHTEKKQTRYPEYSINKLKARE